MNLQQIEIPFSDLESPEFLRMQKIGKKSVGRFFYDYKVNPVVFRDVSLAYKGLEVLNYEIKLIKGIFILYLFVRGIGQIPFNLSLKLQSSLYELC